MHYDTNGVQIIPSMVSRGENVRIEYNGLLFNNGADQVVMHMGYGEEWNNQQDIIMTKRNNGFEASVSVSDNDDIHLAFKDSANNWDNNNGWNYMVRCSR